MLRWERTPGSLETRAKPTRRITPPKGTGHQHHLSSRVNPTMVNGTSPVAVTTAHRQRDPNTWWVPNSRRWSVATKQAHSRERMGGTKFKLCAWPKWQQGMRGVPGPTALMWTPPTAHKTSPCSIVTSTHPSEHMCSVRPVKPKAKP